MAISKLTLEDRFWRQVDKSGDCWRWTGGTDNSYGRLYDGVRPVRAHRFSWEIHNGPIPEGMVVCHRCDNPPCVNPAHLFIGTQADNVRDMNVKGRANARFKGGRPHGNAKLTIEQVQEIRRQFDARVPRGAIAREFGVVKTVIERIGCGEMWAHLPREVRS